MKIQSGFILRNVADSYVVVPVGDNLVDFSAMITLNETGAFLWNILSEKDCDLQYLADALCREYDVDDKTAKNDAEEFVNLLSEKKVLS